MQMGKTLSPPDGSAALSKLALTTIELGVSPSQVEMIGRAFLQTAAEMRAAGIEDTAHREIGHA